jgi:hypothetical protein
MPKTIAINDLETTSVYAITPTAAGTKNTAMLRVITVAVFFTFSGETILKRDLEKAISCQAHYPE